MLEVIVVYTDGEVETYSILTYLKGEPLLATALY